MGEARRYVMMLIIGLVAFVVAVPVLTAIFSDGGAFSDLNTLVASDGNNAITDSTYRPILAAIFALIPLGLMITVGWYFVSWRTGKESNGGGSRRRGRRPARRARRSRRRSRGPSIPLGNPPGPLGGGGIPGA